MEDYKLWLGWLAAASVVMFVGSLLAVPAILIRLPADYFTHPRRRTAVPAGWPVVGYYGWRMTKNVAGVVLIFMGAAMLVLPGQGILSMLIGLSLLDFPGKFRLERWIATRPPIRRSLDWIRQRYQRPAFRWPGHVSDVEDPLHVTKPAEAGHPRNDGSSGSAD